MTFAFTKNKFAAKAAIMSETSRFLAESHNIHAKADEKEQGQRCQWA